MKASDFNRKFDEGEDVTADLDLSKARRPAQEQRRVNPDRQATIWLPLRGPDEREQEIKAIIEGFDGFMTLPPAVTIALDLDLQHVSQ